MRLQRFLETGEPFGLNVCLISGQVYSLGFDGVFYVHHTQRSNHTILRSFKKWQSPTQMSFFQRLVSYVINDVAVKALSNSRAFQRFALKTHYHMEDAKTVASTSANVLKNSFENYAPKIKEFGEAFREELARDMKKVK